MHHPTFVLVQLVGLGLSALLAFLLGLMVWKVPGPGRGARMLFATCGLAWALGKLLHLALLEAGFAEDAGLVASVQFAAFCAGAAWPISVPLLWQEHADLSTLERRLGQALVRLATAACVVLIASLLYAGVLGKEIPFLAILPAYNAAAILTIAAALAYRHLRTSAERIAVVCIVLGPLFAAATHAALTTSLLAGAWAATFHALAKQSMILTFMGGLVYFGRFRTLDRFAKLGLRIGIAWLLAVTAGWALLAGLGDDMPATPMSLMIATLVIAAALLSFGLLGSASDALVDRRVFGRTDPEAALAELRERLAREETRACVLAVAETFVRDLLQVNARIVPRTVAATLEHASAGQRRGKCHRTEHIAVPAADLESQEDSLVMRLEPNERRLLVSAQMSLLNQAAQLVGRRLEAMERERERLERSRREASLVHQLVEAELRALRAQINPHFLFNSLNTIASLVHDDPAVAERMAVRLARIFRHVLAQTERPFSSVREEVDFLRAYLDIEQIRFGERLTVDFRVADALAELQIPSLILQPLVENAIKHGLAPKVGPCRLVISGARDGEHLVLAVEDDGVGGNHGASPAATPSAGIGLRNVRERLRTLYGEHGRLLFETRARLGSRAAIFVPLVAR